MLHSHLCQRVCAFLFLILIEIVLSLKGVSFFLTSFRQVHPALPPSESFAYLSSAGTLLIAHSLFPCSPSSFSSPPSPFLFPCSRGGTVVCGTTPSSRLFYSFCHHKQQYAISVSMFCIKGWEPWAPLILIGNGQSWLSYACNMGDVPSVNIHYINSRTAWYIFPSFSICL